MQAVDESESNNSGAAASGRSQGGTNTIDGAWRIFERRQMSTSRNVAVGGGSQTSASVQIFKMEGSYPRRWWSKQC